MSGYIDNKDIKARAIEAYHEGLSVENAFAGALAVGDLVYISGYNTTSTSAFYRLPRVTKADADGGAASGQATFVVVSAIPQSGGGRVARGALLTGLDTSSWGSAGDPVYLSTTAGERTPTAPSGADDNVQIVGHVLVKSATVGEIAFNLRDNVVTRAGGSAALFLASDNTFTGTNDFSKTVTTTDQLINADLSVNSATAVGIAGDFSATQATTARTSGTMTAVKGTVTSLTGDTAGVDYYAFEAAVTVGAAGADHFAFKQGAGFDKTIDSSSTATTETGWMVGENLASAWTLGTPTLTYVTLVTTTATPGITETWAQTAAGFGHQINYSLDHATSSGSAFRVVATQLSTVRTSGQLSGIASGCTSLAGDLNDVVYADYHASAPTDGGGAVIHVALNVAAGHDAVINSSAAASGETDWIVGANLASAAEKRTSALTYEVLKTTTATPGIDWTFTLTAAEQALHLTTVANLGSGAISGFHSTIATATTIHTAGVIAAYKASVTSIAQDTGGDYTALHIVSVDGGGTTPFHSGIYCDDPLDALIKVAADGDGGVVVGATMTRSPETDTESGYFRFNVGATVYQVPIYAA